jgi:predicted ribosomally synthesized peptide with SipW-like signal peptide
MTNKIKLIVSNVLLAVTMLLLVGVTIAYFQSSASFENIFNTGTYKVVTTEVFESPDNWMPGEEIPKTITTKNEGTIPAAVRVSYTEKWEDSNGTDITSTIDNGTAIINLDNTNEWTKEGNYYYYKYILNPNETTSSFMKSVTLNPDLNGVTCTGEGLTRTCESTNPVTGAKYILTLTKETVQADKYQT